MNYDPEGARVYFAGQEITGFHQEGLIVISKPKTRTYSITLELKEGCESDLYLQQLLRQGESIENLALAVDGVFINKDDINE